MSIKKCKLQKSLAGDLAQIYVFEVLLQKVLPIVGDSDYSISEDQLTNLKQRVSREQSENHAALITKQSVNKWVKDRQVVANRTDQDKALLEQQKLQAAADRVAAEARKTFKEAEADVAARRSADRAALLVREANYGEECIKEIRSMLDYIARTTEKGRTVTMAMEEKFEDSFNQWVSVFESIRGNHAVRLCFITIAKLQSELIQLCATKEDHPANDNETFGVFAHTIWGKEYMRRFKVKHDFVYDQEFDTHFKRVRAGKRKREAKQRLVQPIVPTLNAVQSNCNGLTKVLKGKLKAISKKVALRSKLTTQKITTVGRKNSAKVIFSQVEAQQSSEAEIEKPDCPPQFQTLEEYQLFLVKELEGLLQYQCQNRHNVNGGDLLTKEPEVASIYILLDPSAEHVDQIQGTGALRSKKDADVYHRLLKAQFVDNRRYGDGRAAIKRPPKYSIPAIVGATDNSMGLDDDQDDSDDAGDTVTDQ